MAKQPGDNLCLYLQNGRFNLRITGKRGDNFSVGIRIINSPHFYEVLRKLCEYHRDCLANFHNPEAIAPNREGRGDYKPRLVEWDLKVVDLLPSPQQEVLEHIVSMHNQVASAERRYKAADMELQRQGE